MGKKLLAVVLAVATAAAWGGPLPKERTAAIARLLNSRAAGSTTAYAESAKIVAEDARAGHPVQQFVLALVSKDADAPEAARLTEAERKAYLDQSRERLKSLAERKANPLALYLLALENNDLQLLKRAADANSVQALNAYGTITLTQALCNPEISNGRAEEAVRRSFACFKRAADQEDSNGYYNLGMCYLNGYGTECSRSEAFRLFRLAAKDGHPEAINNIGGFYREGLEVERDPVAAANWFKKSAEMGNAYGELNYALALQRGEGVTRDAPRAAEMFRAAAEKGNAEAMNAYGMCLFTGDGVAKDKTAAVGWYRRSAAQGFPPAMDNLATCCSMGVGGLEKSERAATVWKIRGKAARGDGNAAVWLEKNGEKLR